MRSRWRWRWFKAKRAIQRLTICAVRGHHAGQIELYPKRSKGVRWSYTRECKRCGFTIGCRYESGRGIYEYEPGIRHDGRLELDVVIEEAREAADVR